MTCIDCPNCGDRFVADNLLALECPRCLHPFKWPTAAIQARGFAVAIAER
jgi:uncharacterized Zn ribbon protein